MHSHELGYCTTEAVMLAVVSVRKKAKKNAAVCLTLESRHSALRTAVEQSRNNKALETGAKFQH